MIGAIENAIIATLEAAADAGQLGYGWQTLDTYPDDFDAYLKEKGKVRTPAAWAVFLGLSDGDDAGDGGWTADARYALVVAAQDLRNETATRHGSQGEPGSYQLAEDAIRLLSRVDLDGLLVKPIRITGARLVARQPETRTQRMSLVAIELVCGIRLDRFDGGNVADFETFHADWDVPPLGDVTAPLPADAPDAEDLVELPQ